MRLNAGESLVMTISSFQRCPTLALSRVGISPAPFVRQMGCRSRQRIDLDQYGMSQRGIAGRQRGKMGGRVVVIRQDGDCQSEVLAFLSNPATYGGAPVRRIDTHSAVGFLAGDCPFRVKRAVPYSIMNFSTLAKRRATCEAQLKINRVFSPRLDLVRI